MSQYIVELVVDTNVLEVNDNATAASLAVEDALDVANIDDAQMWVNSARKRED